MNSQTQQTILNSARDAFSQQGYHAVSVQQIIESAGMAKGSFYNYFKSKRDIFDHLLRNLIEEIAGRVEAIDIMDVVDQSTYESVGLRLGFSVAEPFIRDRSLARLFFMESAGLDDDSNRMVEEAYARITDATQRFIERGQRCGVVREDLPAIFTASAMVGMCSHLIQRSLNGAFSDHRPEEILRAITQIHFHGIFR